MDWQAIQASAYVISLGITIGGAAFAFLWGRLSATRVRLAEIDKQAALNALEISYLRRDVDAHLAHAPDVQSRLTHLEANVDATKADVAEIKADVRDIKGALLDRRP